MSLRLPGECEHYVKAEACRFCADVPALRAALRECVEALEGYHKTTKSTAYAQWTPEMHRADAALSRAKRLVK